MVFGIGTPGLQQNIFPINHYGILLTLGCTRFPRLEPNPVQGMAMRYVGYGMPANVLGLVGDSIRRADSSFLSHETLNVSHLWAPNTCFIIWGGPTSPPKPIPGDRTAKNRPPGPRCEVTEPSRMILGPAKHRQTTKMSQHVRHVN